jgi:hypothetical protein
MMIRTPWVLLRTRVDPVVVARPAAEPVGPAFSPVPPTLPPELWEPLDPCAAPGVPELLPSASPATASEGHAVLEPAPPGDAGLLPADSVGAVLPVASTEGLSVGVDSVGPGAGDAVGLPLGTSGGQLPVGQPVSVEPGSPVGGVDSAGLSDPVLVSVGLSPVVGLSLVGVSVGSGVGSGVGSSDVEGDSLSVGVGRQVGDSVGSTGGGAFGHVGPGLPSE